MLNVRGILPSGTKDRLRAAGLPLAEIDRLTMIDAERLLNPPRAIGQPIPGARPLSDYDPADLADEAKRVAAMMSVRR
jgi:hypothetical protein